VREVAEKVISITAVTAAVRAQVYDEPDGRCRRVEVPDELFQHRSGELTV
jgi:hypothetical protein